MTPSHEGRNDDVNILLVEDDEVDRKAVKRAFGRLDVPVNIVEAADGCHALAILRGEGGVTPPPRPYVILLDINLPKMDGIEMLAELRSERYSTAVRNSIVFMLTTSEANQDRDRAYAHHVAGYLVKSELRGGLAAIAEMIKAYRQVVLLP